MPASSAVTHIDAHDLKHLKAQLQTVLTMVQDQLKGIGALSSPNLTRLLQPVDNTLGVLAGATGSAIGTALNNALTELGGSIHDQLVYLQNVLTEMIDEIDTTISSFANTESLNTETADQLLAEFQSTIADPSGATGPGRTGGPGNGPVTLAAVNGGNGPGNGPLTLAAVNGGNSGGGGGGGGVSGWIAQAFSVLEANGVPASQLNTSDVELIIQHESGGNPSAVNLTDGNAAAGTPSTGLMQVIQPTFNANALPGFGDITNPVDNIIAGVRYALAKYGSLDNVPGVVAVHNGQPYVGY